jgi:hypothetical protein
MFSPKLLKFLISGAASLIVLGTAVLGVSRLSQPVDDQDYVVDPYSSRRIVVIDELTEIVVEQWCMICNERYRPTASVFYREWYGKTKTQLQNILEDHYPGSTLVSFFGDQVIVHMPPGRCQQCIDIRWPQRGYIGLVDGSQMAVFTETGIVVEKLGEAPGAWIGQLEQGIPFESPEECELWLVNLTS